MEKPLTERQPLVVGTRFGGTRRLCPLPLMIGAAAIIGLTTVFALLLSLSGLSFLVSLGIAVLLAVLSHTLLRQAMALLADACYRRSYWGDKYYARAARMATALGFLGGNAARRVLLQRLPVTRTSAPHNAYRMEKATMISIGRVANVQCMDALRKCYASNGSHSMHTVYAAEILYRLGDRAPLDELLITVRPESFHPWREGIAMLSRLRGEEAAVDWLLEGMLCDNETRVLCSQALRRLGHPAFFQCHHTTGELDFAKLWQSGDERAIQWMLDSVDRHSGIAAALGAANDSRARGPLLKLLKNQNVNLRVWAAGALGNLNDKSVRQELLAALSDLNLDVRRNAALALQRIGTGDLSLPSDTLQSISTHASEAKKIDAERTRYEEMMRLKRGGYTVCEKCMVRMEKREGSRMEDGTTSAYRYICPRCHAVQHVAYPNQQTMDY